MQFRLITNLFLFIFAIGAIVVLFKYTTILDTGFANSLNEGIYNLKRIIREDKPETQLSETEKEKLKKSLDENEAHAQLFCNSAYFPFVPGANWTYQVTSGGNKDVIKIGIPSAENGVVNLDGRLVSRDNWTNRTLAICRDGKIHLTDVNFFLVFGRERTVTTPCQENQYNFFFPKDSDLIKGNAWFQESCFNHVILDENFKDKQMEFKENLEIKEKVLGQEDVEVPGGTFTSVKLSLELSGKQELPGGVKTVDSTIYFWISQGVGVVKSTYQEKNSDKPVVEQELSGFQIPTEKGFKSSGR